MMAVIEFSLFLGAVTMIGLVFWSTLMPALPRIVALLTADEAAMRSAATVTALVPARVSAPVWRAAA